MKNMSAGMKVAVLIILITFLYLFAVTFFEMPESGVEQAKTIVPFLLGSVIGTLIGFYYGKKHEQPPTIEDRRKEVV
jgi:type III secretory pathway component EscU